MKPPFGDYCLSIHLIELQKKKYQTPPQGIFDVGKKKMPCDESPKLKLADEIPHCGECSKTSTLPESGAVFFLFSKREFFRRYLLFLEFLK